MFEMLSLGSFLESGDSITHIYPNQAVSSEYKGYAN